MQAIQTKVIPATEHRKERIKAVCKAKSHTINIRHNARINSEHKRAVIELLEILGWRNKFVSGVLKDGSYVHVLI